MKKRQSQFTIKKWSIACFAIFLMMLPLTTNAQSIQNSEITFKERSTTLRNLIKDIEKRTTAKFIYDDTSVDMNKSVRTSAGRKRLEDVFSEILTPLSLKAVYLDQHIIIEPQGAAAPKVGGKLIKGQILDTSGEPLVGATVLIAGSSRGTATDLKGNFSLTLLPQSRLLKVSYIGYLDQVVNITEKSSSYKVTLKPSETTLEDVVVIGYGSQKKRDLTGAITSISSKDMDSSVSGNIETSLQGKIPGLRIVSDSGEPGAGSTITIRGASSINGSSEPLYIIDGMPIESGNISSITGDAKFSPIAGLNPSDIESIEVLRDAASAAIYGSRAANGVVIITTKGGNSFQAKRPTVSFSHTSSIASVYKHLDVMNGQQFRQAYTDARVNANLSIDNILWLANPLHPYYNNSTDWQSLLFRNTYQTKNDILLNGGTDNVSYGVSFGYTEAAPVVEGTEYKNISSRANFFYRLGKNLIGSTKVYFYSIDYDRVLSGQSNMSSLLRTIVSTPPIFSPYDPAGVLVDKLGQNEARNPLALAKKFPIEFKRNNITLNQMFRYIIMRELEFQTSIGMERYDIGQSSYLPKSFDTNGIDVARESFENSSKFVNENTLNYKKTFNNNHNFDALLGLSIQKNKFTTRSTVGRDFIDETNTSIQNGANIISVRKDIDAYAMLSFFGRINYNYQSRYLLSATFRRDGSSRFGRNNRFGNFPSISAAWRFSDEAFMMPLKNILFDGKLRASFGLTGSQNVGNYAWQGTYSADSGSYDGKLSVYHTNLSNENLKWETTAQYNLGLDLTFFGGRLQFNADAYIKKTSDLLFNTPIPGYLGFTQYMENLGSIENRGLEFLVSGTPLEIGSFRWDLNFNLSFNRNKVTLLANGEDVIVDYRNIAAIARKGHPVGMIYGWEALGVYASTRDNVWTNPVTGESRPVKKGTVEGKAFEGGDMIWRDLNNDGVINDDDRTIIGNPYPKFDGGFGTTFSYKNLSLNVFFTYSYGNDIVNAQRNIRNQMSNISNLGTDALRRWRNDGDVTDFPKLVYGDPMENFRTSTFTIEDGSFLRLKDVSLTYSLPKKVAKNLKMSNVDFTLSGTNLLIWSKYSGFDPEVNSPTNPFLKGIDEGVFPKSRTASLGIKLTF